MRTFLFAVFVATLPALSAPRDNGALSPITIVLKYEHKDYSAAAMKSMRDETESLLREAGLQVEWALYHEVAGRQDLGDMLVFRMRGKCLMDAMPVVLDELGLPFALTHVSNGDILPFGDVDCNRVRNAAKAGTIDFRKADFLYGRALGRVIAHEVYHMYARSRSHAGKGVTRECLSPKELTIDRMSLSEESLSAIRSQIALMRSRATAESLPDSSLP